MKYKNFFLHKNELKNILNIYELFINKVGISKLYYPIIFDNGFGKLQKTVGLWNISISLMNYKRGIHMSRFIIILEKVLLKKISFKYFNNLYKIFLKIMESNDILIQLSFLYFLKKISPISFYKSFLNYKLTIFFEKKNINFISILKIIVPISSLCPCSKLISKFNAHNQRSYISLSLLVNKKINISKIIKITEEQSSSSLWSLLKRSDEKYVTEFSYKNPVFIEDLIRNLYFEIKNFKFFLKIENLESIHNHNVYSYLKKIN